MLNNSAQPEELPIDDKESPRKEGIPLPLIGDRNSTISVEDGLLVEKFYDGSGRDNPLTRYYEFNGKRFTSSKDVYGPTYNPSFDCRKAKSDREITVCGNEELAKKDIELNTVFQALLKTQIKSRVAHVDRRTKKMAAKTGQRERPTNNLTSGVLCSPPTKKGSTT